MENVDFIKIAWLIILFVTFWVQPDLASLCHSVDVTDAVVCDHSAHSAGPFPVWPVLWYPMVSLTLHWLNDSDAFSCHSYLISFILVFTASGANVIIYLFFGFLGKGSGPSDWFSSELCRSSEDEEACPQKVLEMSGSRVGHRRRPSALLVIRCIFELCHTWLLLIILKHLCFWNILVTPQFLQIYF